MYSTIEKYNHYPYGIQATENNNIYNCKKIFFLWLLIRSQVKWHDVKNVACYFAPNSNQTRKVVSSYLLSKFIRDKMSNVWDILILSVGLTVHLDRQKKLYWCRVNLIDVFVAFSLKGHSAKDGFFTLNHWVVFHKGTLRTDQWYAHKRYWCQINSQVLSHGFLNDYSDYFLFSIQFIRVISFQEKISPAFVTIDEFRQLIEIWSISPVSS